MSDLQIFRNSEFGQIRTLESEGKTLFVAVDIAKSLGYKDTTNAIKQHCRWVVKHHIPHPQNLTKFIEVNMIPEGDIYRLVSNSELPGALKFESWIYDEVLPSIHKTGSYNTETNTIETNLDRAVQLFNATYESLYPETRDSAFQYLWEQLTGAGLNHASLVPKAPHLHPALIADNNKPTTVKTFSPKRKYMATNAIADNALELVKTFIKKHKRSFEPRYGLFEPDYIYIRSSLFDTLVGYQRKAVLNNWADRGWIKFRSYPDYRDFTRKRVDHYLHKYSNYIAIKSQILKERRPDQCRENRADTANSLNI